MRVVVFKAIFKLVGEEDGAQLSNNEHIFDTQRIKTFMRRSL